MLQEGLESSQDSGREIDEGLAKPCDLKSLIKKMCPRRKRWWLCFEGVNGLRLGRRDSPEALR